MLNIKQFIDRMVVFGLDLLAKSKPGIIEPDYYPMMSEPEHEYVRVKREGEGYFSVVKKPKYNRRDSRGRFVKSND